MIDIRRHFLDKSGNASRCDNAHDHCGGGFRAMQLMMLSICHDAFNKPMGKASPSSILLILCV